MKIRTDFVTNSSSSSFLLVRKGTLNERQKAAILDYVEKRFLGERILSRDSTIEEIRNTAKDLCLEDYDLAMCSAMSNGYDIYVGTIHYEGGCDIADVYSDIWRIMISNSELGTFIPVKYDLG